ncbi:hypothetical protein P7K49_017347 [Saguinus oedipus]|uniref:Uncharacterized protein n=1 Tax=Saguinus oedipus TaxID=9490 RepID=A0ABQ9V2X7_SAGOE|nr:hypothetical protein P7K49_017347 [Saguinus oedipus]
MGVGSRCGAVRGVAEQCVGSRCVGSRLMAGGVVDGVARGGGGGSAERSAGSLEQDALGWGAGLRRRRPQGAFADPAAARSTLTRPSGDSVLTDSCSLVECCNPAQLLAGSTIDIIKLRKFFCHILEKKDDFDSGKYLMEGEEMDIGPDMDTSNWSEENDEENDQQPLSREDSGIQVDRTLLEEQDQNRKLDPCISWKDGLSQGGRIASIVAGAPPPPGCTVLDASSKTLSPERLQSLPCLSP